MGVREIFERVHSFTAKISSLSANVSFCSFAPQNRSGTGGTTGSDVTAAGRRVGGGHPPAGSPVCPDFYANGTDSCQVPFLAWLCWNRFEPTECTTKHHAINLSATPPQGVAVYLNLDPLGVAFQLV